MENQIISGIMTARRMKRENEKFFREGNFLEKETIMRYMIRAFHAMEWCVAVPVILLSAILVVPGWFGIRAYIVRSGSMEPVLHTGALAFVDTRAQDYECGDIITYRLSDSREEDILVTHRIIGETEDGFITRGDANEVQDPVAVERMQIIGRVLGQIPKAGYLAAKVNPKICMAAIFWILFLNTLSFTTASMVQMSASEPTMNANRKEERSAGSCDCPDPANRV